MLVSSREHTYLTAETGNHGEGFLDPYQTLDIYYVKPGNLLQTPKRQLLHQIRDSQYGHELLPSKVHFYRIGDEESDPIEVWLLGEQLFTFTPPAHFIEDVSSKAK